MSVFKTAQPNVLKKLATNLNSGFAANSHALESPAYQGAVEGVISNRVSARTGTHDVGEEF